MKKILLSTSALIALGMATSASAADLGARTYTKAPPMTSAVYDWTGFYIGANVGGVWARSDVTDQGSPAGLAYSAGAPAGTVTPVRKDAVFGGGQVGYNWQAASWVFGIEGDGGYMALRRTVPLTATASGTTVGLRDVAYGDITGRIGYTWGPGLLYVKGGYAVMQDPSRFATVTGSFSGRTLKDTVSGYTIGAGLEYKLAQNWSMKAEYLHFDFGTDPSYTVSNAVGTPFGFRQTLTLDTVKVGLNYMWGGPVVARY